MDKRYYKKLVLFSMGASLNYLKRDCLMYYWCISNELYRIYSIVE